MYNNLKNILKEVGYTSYYDPFYKEKTIDNESEYIENVIKKYIFNNIDYDYFEIKNDSSIDFVEKIVVDDETYDHPILYKFKIVVSKGLNKFFYTIYIFLDKNYNFRYIDAPKILNVQHYYNVLENYSGYDYYYDYDLTKFTGKTKLLTKEFIQELIQV